MKYIQVFIVALFFTNNLSAQTGYKIIYEAITFVLMRIILKNGIGNL